MKKERDMIIDHCFYQNITGSKGDNICEIWEKFNQRQVTFPGPGYKHVVKIHSSK
jgi:hypothetical protein